MKAVFAFLAFCLVPVLFGCGPQRAATPPDGPSKSGVKPRDGQDDEMPSQVTTRGITILWREKSKAGRLQRVMDVEAETGIVNAETQSGTLNRANGKLYREDRARATFVAPIVEAAEDRSTVVARGGVTMRSVDPPGVTLTARRVTWRVAKNLIQAEGGVRVVYQPPGAPQPTALGTAERLTINTELQQFHIP